MIRHGWAGSSVSRFALVPDFFCLSPRHRAHDAARTRLLDISAGHSRCSSWYADWSGMREDDEMPTNAWSLITLPCVLLALLLLA